MDPRLICTGIELDEVVVPPFEVSSDELIGLIVPVAYGDNWLRLMKALASDSTSGVTVLGGVMLIAPPLLVRANRRNSRMTIEQYIATTGLSHNMYGGVCDKLGLRCDECYWGLQFTTRFLLDVLIAWHRNVDIIVMATAGLGSTGVGRVVEAIRSRGQWAALDIISSAVSKKVESYSTYTRMIPCKVN